jgi:hypothetical protein
MSEAVDTIEVMRRILQAALEIEEGGGPALMPAESGLVIQGTKQPPQTTTWYIGAINQYEITGKQTTLLWVSVAFPAMEGGEGVIWKGANILFYSKRAIKGTIERCIKWVEKSAKTQKIKL